MNVKTTVNSDPLAAALAGNLSADEPAANKVPDDWDTFFNEPSVMDRESRRAAEVDELLERSAILREDVEGKTEPLPVDPADRALGDFLGESEASLTLDDILASSPEAETTFTDTELQQMHDNVQVLENSYMDKYRAFKSAEAAVTRLQESFNTTHADLINLCKVEKQAASDLELRLKEAAEIYAKASGEKKFDSYVQCKAYSEVLVTDRAAATTWAETAYPAALNKTLNDKIVTEYLKELVANEETLPDWATLEQGLRAEVSKKFVGADA